MGMSFGTPDAREAFFAAAEAGCRRVRPGTWISHARDTNLGIWGDEHRLREDCARIAACELVDCGLLSSLPEPRLVMHTRAFQEAFSHARRGADRILGNQLHGALPAAHPLMQALMGRGEDADADDCPDPEHEVAADIAAELTGCGSRLCGRQQPQTR